MPKIAQSVCFILLSICIFNCTDEIAFEEAKTLEDAISIQGRITKGNPSKVRVEVKETFNFTTNPRFINVKSAELLDELGNTLELTSKQQGVYEIEIPDDHSTFEVAYGKAYGIRLELFDGQMFESALDTLNAVPDPSDLKVEKTEQTIINSNGETEVRSILSYAVSTPLSSPNNTKKSYFLWELESVFKQSDTPTIRAGCIVPSCLKTSDEVKTCFQKISPVNNYKVLDANLLTGDIIENFILFEDGAMSGSYAEGYYLTVFQQALSSSAFDYWSAVNLIVNRTGSQFEGPVGQIPTNLRNLSDPSKRVYGFFFSTESKLKRVYVSPSFADFPRPTCPAPETDGISPSGRLEVCCNCLCQPNSSLLKPDWWDQ